MASTETPILGSKTSAISNMVVRLTSQYTGRGPTKARTYIHDDLVTCVLQDTLTKAEHTLVGNDHRELVLAMRHAFQQAMQADLVAGVQEILGREVVAFLSANHTDPDYAVETFILAPRAHTAAGPVAVALT
jgi:uncharacterized protein YbcI